MSAIARQAGLNDGKGFLFVSHTGGDFPSGFLEIAAGNARRTPLADAYRHSDLFRALRDSGRLEGKCGTGNFLASGPSCVYQPGKATLAAQR
jgi:AdoMet-dependent heme synthase